MYVICCYLKWNATFKSFLNHCSTGSRISSFMVPANSALTNKQDFQHNIKICNALETYTLTKTTTKALILKLIGSFLTRLISISLVNIDYLINHFPSHWHNPALCHVFMFYATSATWDDLCSSSMSCNCNPEVTKL